jgi:ferredoxin
VSAVVEFSPLGVVEGVEESREETLLELARRAGVPLGSACSGAGVCGRCRVEVVEGSGSLTRPTALETAVAERCALGSSERLACQAVVAGPCRVSSPGWGVTRRQPARSSTFPAT